MSTAEERPKLINAEPLANKQIKLFYENGEVKVFSVKEWIEKYPIFAHLKDEENFRNLKVRSPYVAFDEKTDFSPEVLYDKSEMFYA
ncbi:DUF2442 domain-containing protein [Pseudolactococcus insecticola]|uniref:Uncharacterized protein n=1 Tax=Pseudolactococcus insecticola TaxID=2709158 RepID=A0A6A0B622_9LACT|nr:DUF2442 domain-containing protein [Lactococcus insecticola]GFH40850.1 hypothetical protein Hs20B_12480 [Lactococcus insecticola]